MRGLRWLYRRSIRETQRPTTGLGILLFRKPREIMARCKSTKPVSDVLLAVYDLQVAPITFNFSEFLMLAGMESAKRGLQGFHVLFVPRVEDPVLGWKMYDSIHDEHSKEWRFREILLPLTRFTSLCRGFTLLTRRSDIKLALQNQAIFPALYSETFLDVHDPNPLYRELDPEYIGFTAPIQARRHIDTWKQHYCPGTKIVTLTVRDQLFDPTRNTDLNEAERFLHDLRGKGYHPVLIPDTDKAWGLDHRFASFTILHEAAWNLPLRMALYETSYLNFFNPNGSIGLVIFNKHCSYIIMKFLPANSVVTTAEAVEKTGMHYGEHYRFAKPWQRIIWEADTLETYQKAFTEFVADFPEWPPNAPANHG